jgi:hypothetical protein
VFGRQVASGMLRAEPWARFVEGHPNPRRERASGSGSMASVRLQTSPRQAPLSRPRDSISSLNRSKSFDT